MKKDGGGHGMVVSRRIVPDSVQARPLLSATPHSGRFLLNYRLCHQHSRCNDHGICSTTETRTLILVIVHIFWVILYWPTAIHFDGSAS